jgi:hypothetical protein
MSFVIAHPAPLATTAGHWAAATATTDLRPATDKVSALAATRFNAHAAILNSSGESYAAVEELSTPPRPAGGGS